MIRTLALSISILLWADAAFAVGLWGRVTPFSKGEVWATGGVLLKDHYTLGLTATQDGNAVEFGLAYPFSRFGMTSNMVHLSLGLINQWVDVKVGPPQEFHSYYGTLALNYTLFFAGARVVERDIDHDLVQKRGRIVRKSINDFFIGLGIFFTPGGAMVWNASPE
ncbi:hypothetical protein [Oligoflexus tunisiensis]|uniref:hypothetical protein n=1 Tax=Oligoflexus tunisiensis TaxID=708132 RepID=UPI001C40364A|nr:hypothetical protein [Oligoflexus tunisiensis]